MSMPKVIAIHSYKGGTGKSIIATNLTTIFSEKKDSCVLDLDFRAPSLHITFHQQVGKARWINDYLDAKCEAKEVVSDATGVASKGSRVYVGLANPSMTAIREMLTKDRRWEMMALNRLNNLVDYLLNQKTEYVVIDTSPGIHYSSINAAVVADKVLVVTTHDESDIDGTAKMIKEMYELIERPIEIVMNRVPAQIIAENGAKEYAQKIEDRLGAKVVGVIPCSCDILATERKEILAKTKPQHEFVKHLENISQKI